MSFGVKLAALLAVLGVPFRLYWNIRLASKCSRVVKKRFLWAGDFFLVKNVAVKRLIGGLSVIRCSWTQFLSRACMVGWLTDVLIVLFP